MMKQLLTTLAVTPDSIGLPKVPVDDQTLPNALTITFTVVGALAVLFIIIGAIRYITSNGDTSEIGKAKMTILYAVIGMVLALSAFVIVQFTAESIQ